MSEIIKSEATGIVEDLHGGYGFLQTADIIETNPGHHNDAGTSARIFFHYDDCADFEPEKGDRLRFDIVENEKGYRAKNIEKISKSGTKESDDGPYKPRKEEGDIDAQTSSRDPSDTNTSGHQDSTFH